MTNKERYDISHLIGTRYSSVVIIADAGKKKACSWVVIRCDCGVEKETKLRYLVSGETKSCGCRKKMANTERLTTHGLRHHPLYNTWGKVKSRCYNPKNMRYKYYGGRGVTMCEEWKNDFRAFYDWAILSGWEPGLELDKDRRVANPPGIIYSPEYCCFVTRQQNMWSRRDSKMIEYDGKIKCLGEWCFILGKDYQTVATKLNNGMEPRYAFQSTTAPYVLKKKKKSNKQKI